ncbi:hypothetical protein QYM36_015739 [Artemia franciscana]|uniref:Uncharacterized protein n=1 Tax=Artemia franciscana TaxID=6661 RepID=A0AA88HH00_ARTSF|nr:hypothetical protein QYM36_015739 [Artemia franciscana]
MKWLDYESVCIASSFVGAEPSGNCKHWDSKLKKQIDVVHILCISGCYKFTGGGDLSDMLIGLYRIDTRRKKWYMHTMKSGTLNTGFEHKRSRAGIASYQPLPRANAGCRHSEHHHMALVWQALVLSECNCLSL